MRQILFKGMSIETKEWVYGGFYVKVDQETGVEAPVYIVDRQTQEHIECFPESISQWTGLDLKHFPGGNSGLLFEGDIIQFHIPDNPLAKPEFQIVFGQCGCRVYLNGFMRGMATERERHIFKRKMPQVEIPADNDKVHFGYSGFYLLPANGAASKLWRKGIADDLYGVLSTLGGKIVGHVFNGMRVCDPVKAETNE